MKSQEIFSKAQQKAFELGMRMLDIHKWKKQQEELINELEVLEKEWKKEVEKEEIEAKKQESKNDSSAK